MSFNLAKYFGACFELLTKCGWIIYRQGRGDLEIPRFLETSQAILAQIATFLQQCDTQSTNLDDLENAGRGQNAESYSIDCPMEGIHVIRTHGRFVPTQI